MAQASGIQRSFSLRRSTLPFLPALVALAALAIPGDVRAQIIPPVFNSGAAGVYVDADGVLRSRELDGAKAHPKPAKGTDKTVSLGPDGLTYVSLPKLFAQVQEAVAAGKPIADELRHIGGLTEVRYVLVYPDDKDLYIAGPAEDWETDGLAALGKRTGRPVMQLDDLVVALRQGGTPFGCTIDPSPDSLKRSEEVALKYARSSRKERLAALKDALGPQTVKVFGTSADTRTAFAMLAADYRLKRLSLGADKSPVPGVGVAVDDSRAAAFRVWFEPKYEPLLVSPDGNAYQLRGQRLQLKAGAFSFDPRGATPAAQRYADAFTAKIPQLAQSISLFAELQNVADLNVLAALIRTDHLDQKAGWDMSWIRRKDSGYPLLQLPAPRLAEAVVNATNGSIVGGGVEMKVNPFIAPDARQVDREGEAMGQVRERAMQLRTSSGAGAVMNPPASTPSASGQGK